MAKTLFVANLKHSLGVCFKLATNRLAFPEKEFVQISSKQLLNAGVKGINSGNKRTQKSRQLS